MAEAIVTTTTTVPPSKPWYKSITLWGVITGLTGAITTIQATPGLFTPFVALGLLDPTGVAKIALALTAIGPILSLIGRLRPSQGATLTISATPAPTAATGSTSTTTETQTTKIVVPPVPPA